MLTSIELLSHCVLLSDRTYALSPHPLITRHIHTHHTPLIQVPRFRGSGVLPLQAGWAKAKEVRVSSSKLK